MHGRLITQTVDYQAESRPAGGVLEEHGIELNSGFALDWLVAVGLVKIAECQFSHL